MENLHLFIQSPFPQIPSRFISINPNFSLRDLSISLSLPTKTLDSFFFSLNGSPLPSSSAPLHSMLPTTTTLLLHLRLPGGGGDGGATGAESRDCYLNMYAEKKPDKADPNERRLSKWCSCALSADPLRHPCVADRLGNLFNKEPLVEALLAKTLPREFAHIRGLKDMIPIHLSEIPGLNSDDNGISFGARFQCPIAGLEFNGKYRFYALRGCGHVVSAKALKEVKSAECLVCHRRFSEEDKIVINGTPEEVAAMRERMEEERMKLKEKKEKKARNGVVEGVCLGNAKRGLDEKGESLLPPPGVNGAVNLNDGKNSKMVDGVKGANLNASAKRFKAVDLAPAKATKEVYASIFTSSRKSDFKETYSCRSLPLGRN
ncbi:hypothetical protein AAC387_Pa04g1089 [Persea americana]